MQLWIFYGRAGAGKSFVRRICAEEFGFEQYDGDGDLTPEMQRALSESREFTVEMRAAFTAVLSREIRRRCDRLRQTAPPNAGLAVCQGLFKTRNRDELQRQFPEARLVWVRAPEELVEARLRQRAAHLASSEYLGRVNGGFEPPPPESDVLENDGDRSRVVEQLRSLRER